MIVLNEKEYTSECLRKLDLGEHPRTSLLYIAAKLYAEGKSKREITVFLMDFMSRNYPEYNFSKQQWNDSIEQIVKKAKKYILKEDAGVWITRAELDDISNANNTESEKLLFTFLCIAKLRNQRNPKNNSWVNTEYKEIFKLARVQCKASDREYVIGELKIDGYFEFPKKNGKMTTRITFVNDDSEPILHVTDFRELGYCYLRYKGENIIECAECGILTKGNAKGTKRYCSNCVAPVLTRKIVQCLDCDIKFEVDKNSKMIRCPDCRRAKRSETNRQYYEKIKTS